MSDGYHVVVVVGAAVSGSQAAFECAQRGVKVVVLEQNPLPFGKIEDGLPRWHVKLRQKEAKAIVEKLSHPNILYVPNVVLGKDVQLQELVEMGFSAVLLANGAWKDRPVPIEGADRYIGRGLVYQNPFVMAFNHAQEEGGQMYEVPDGTLVLGGGLASIDVIKIVQMTLVGNALKERGIEVDLLELEKRGIPKVLESHGLRYEDLGLEGGLLVYRRRPFDMPLKPLPDNPTLEDYQKAGKVNEKILDNVQRKMCFRFQGCLMPKDLIVEGDRLVGLKFVRTKIEGRRVIPLDEVVEIRAPLVISSIGSIPVPLPGVEMERGLYPIEDPRTGKFKGFERVYGLGNAVTGKGNIRVSREHAKEVSRYVLEEVLRVSGEEPCYKVSSQRWEEIQRWVEGLHRQRGYEGFSTWIERHIQGREIGLEG